MTDEQENMDLDKHVLLGIPLIDNQHANLIKIYHNLRYACLKGLKNTDQYFIDTTHAANDHLQCHFQTEERLMRLCNFPGLENHKKEHNDFIWEILSRSKQLQDEQHLVPEKFVHFLNEWINNHIGISDKAFVDYFLTTKQYDSMKMILDERTRPSANSSHEISSRA